MLTLMKALWKRWKAVAHGIVDAQNAVLLFLVFVFGVAPATLLVRISRRPLLDRNLPTSPPESHWRPLKSVKRDMSWAQRPW